MAESSPHELEAQWRKVLTEGHRIRWAHALFKHLPSEPRCKLCHNPFGGLGGKLVGLLGYTPSPKNPNLCRQCCDGLPAGGAEVDIAVLFADVRGSTTLGEQLSASDYAQLMNRFYLVATRVLVRHDAIIDKLIGDEVMALFIPGIAGRDYRKRAADAATDLLAAVGYGSEDGPWLSVGVGLHAGPAYVGNVGAEGVVDFTALGDAVNTTSRLQGLAQGGEIVLSEPIYADLDPKSTELEPRDVELKGRSEPITIWTLRSSD